MSTRDLDKVIIRHSVELHEAVLRGEPGSSERLDEHLCESRRHTQHYLRATLLDEVFEDVDPKRQWEIGPRAATAPDNVVALPGAGHPGPPERRTEPRARHRWTSKSLAAALLLGLTLTSTYWLVNWNGGWHKYVTAIGEQRAIELPDGSVVHLNTHSHLQVRIASNMREMRLIDGEALFKVHRDATRPFRVYTSNAMVQALGTEFNVYRRSHGTTVSVIEGRVRIERSGGNAQPEIALQPSEPTAATQKPSRARTVDLAAGQRAEVKQNGEIATEAAADLTSATAWRQRRVVFKGARLGEMVEEFNRYNRAPQVVLKGSVSAIPYSGIFDADDPESLIELLRHDPGIQIERQGDVVTIQAKAGHTASGANGKY
jgi:transmembrane sensor